MYAATRPQNKPLTKLIIGWREGCKCSEQALYHFAYARLRELTRAYESLRE